MTQTKDHQTSLADDKTKASVNTTSVAGRVFKNEKLICLIICFFSMGSLATAYISQYHFGLQPCILCLYQRVPYFVLIALSLLGILLSCKDKPYSAYIILLCSSVFMTSALLAFYHTGVEQKWWASFLESCNADFDFSDPAHYIKQLEQTQAVRCDEIPWSDPIIGLSMANYNFILSAIFATLTAKAGLKSKNKYKTKD